MQRHNDDKSSLAKTFQELTDHIVLLFREHLRLFSTEIRRDSSIALRYISALMFFGVVALTGYALLNLSIILFAGWAFGFPAMAFSSLFLSALNMSVPAWAIKKGYERFKEDQLGPRIASAEVERSKIWALTNQN